MAQWCLAHPWMTFFLCLAFSQAVFGIAHKLIRAATIARHGYPPPHCDGDGDFKKAE